MIKKVIVWILFLVLGVFLGVILSSDIKNVYFNLFLDSEDAQIINILPKPLEKYSIINLSETEVKPSKILIEENLSESEKFFSYLFSISFDPTLKGKDIKKVTGLLNVPKKEEKMPLVLLLRGYVDQKIYQTGIGSQRVGEYLANNGFITIAPDFLGYAGSDKETNNIFESRFQTYTTALTVLKSIESIPEWDQENIFIWGHSNGGQIALTLLEITGKEIPTVLWAPVSKPFPYSILYYTDESDDLGKLIRKELSLFEENYDVNLYSIHNYFEKIKAPLEIHQGSYDDAVPVDWTNILVKKLEDLEQNVSYFKYIGADHNMKPSWTLAVQRTLNFYNSFLK